MRTFGELKYDIGERLHDVGAERLLKIGKYLNAVYQDIWNAHLWKDSLVFDQAVNVEDGSCVLLVPAFIQEVIALRNSLAGNLLVPTSAYVFHRQYLNSLSSANGAVAYVRAGSAGVLRQPPVAGSLKIASSSDADNCAVLICGKDAQGLNVEERLALNGTHSVSGTTVFSSITDWSKAGVTQGTVFLYDSQDNELDTICPRERVNRYLCLRLPQAASGSDNYYVSGKKRIVPLCRDEDVPSIPVDSALFSLGLAEGLRQAGKYTQAQTEEARGWSALEKYLNADDVMSECQEATLPCVVDIREDGGI